MAADCGYGSGDKEMKELAAECNQTPGMEWLCQVNRCASTEEAKGYQADFANCLEKEVAAERKVCQDLLAKTFLEEQGFDLQKDAEHGLEIASKALTVIQVTHIIVAKTILESPSKCMPMQLYQGAALTAVITEIGSFFQMQDAVEELEEEYKKEVALKDGHSQQLRSFEFLAQYHDMVAKVANQKKAKYMTLSVSYGAVAIMAAVEAFSTPDTCSIGQAQWFTPKKETQHPLYSSALSTYLEHFFNLIPKAHAQEGLNFAAMTPLLMAFASGSNPSVEEAKNQTKSMLTNSYTIMTLAGISAGIAIKLFTHFKSIEKKSKENANRIREIASEFMAIATANCSKRNNPGQPECYCYNNDQTLNEERGKEQVCKDFIASFLGTAKSAGDFKLENFDNPGCVTSGGDFDKKCSCKTTNSCFEPPPGSANFGSIGTKVNASQLLALNQGIAAGKIQAGNLDASTLQKQAKKNSDLLKKIKSEGNAERIKAGKDPLFLSPKGLASKLIDKIATPDVVALAQGSGRDLFSPPNNLHASLVTANKKVQDRFKKLGKSSSAIASGGGLGLDSFLKPKASSTSGNKVESFGDKNYDVDKGTIHEDTKSLWDILTDRYRKSGQRRLQ
jgi:hypothetical protein